MQSKTLFIVDGHSLIFRAYYAMHANPLVNSYGDPIGCIFAFYKMIAKLLKIHQPDYFIIIFDPKGKVFRDEIYPDYKMNRKPVPPDLPQQIQEIIHIIAHLNIPYFIPDNAEADDGIASIVEQYKNHKDLVLYILSGDKDLYNILFPSVTMLRPVKGVSEFKRINAKSIKEEIGILPEEIPAYMALTGDSADYIPGVKGIGTKGASKLIQQFKTLDNIYKNISSISSESIRNKLLASKENAFLSQTLVTLKKDIPIPFSLEDLEWTKAINTVDDIQIFLEKELPSVYDDWLGLLQHLPSKSIISNTNDIAQNIQLITTPEQLSSLVKHLQQFKEIAIDTETDNLSVMQANLVGVSLSWYDAQKYYSAFIPCPCNPQSKKHPDYDCLMPVNAILSALKTILEDPQTIKIGHNIKYDILVLRQHNIQVQGTHNTIHDTMILSYVLGTHKQHGLDYLTYEYLQHNMLSYDTLVKRGKDKLPLLSLPLDKLSYYACEDAEATLRIFHILLEQMNMNQTSSKLYYDIDLPLIPVLIDMEFDGIIADTQYLQTLQDNYENDIFQLEQEIYTLANKTFNIRSTKELGSVLFKDLQIKSSKKTVTGKFSTNQKVLNSLKNQHPIINKLLEFRLLNKLLSGYIIPLIQYINPQTKRIHTSFSQTVTGTARLASTHPNLQNIPIRGKEGSKLRQVFIADNDYELLALDYSQIELRILAHMSKDTNLLQAYTNNEDIHDRSAYLLFRNQFNFATGMWLENTTDIQPTSQFNAEELAIMKSTLEFSCFRDKAKILNFSIVYGITPWGLSQYLNITPEEAKTMINNYFHTYQGVKRYMDSVIEQSRNTQYVDNLFGRRRKIDGLFANNASIRSSSERLAMNTPIQSTAADLVKRCMIVIHKEMSQKSYKSKLLLQIHDELLFEVYHTEKEEIFSMVKDKMENTIKLDVPLLVNGEFSKTWKGTK